MKKLFLFALMFSLSLAAAQNLGGRTVVVGSDTTYPPFETVNEQGEIVGFDIDVVNAICARINCVARFQTTAWDGIFPALLAGEFDMVASGVSITPERQQVVEFSTPYLVVNQAMTVRVEDEDLTFDDFEAGNQIVGAQTGTTNAILAEEAFGRERLRLYDDFNAAVLALLNGDVDAVVIDGVTADAFVQQYAGQLVVSIRGLSADPLGFVFRPGDELVDAFDDGLAAIRADGTLNEIIERWFGSADE